MSAPWTSHRRPAVRALLLASITWWAGCRDGGCCSRAVDETQPEVDRRSALSELREVEPASSADATSYNLSVGADGSVVASWLEPGASALRWRRRVDGRWTDVQTAVEGAPLFVNWADVPTVTIDPQGRIVAVWLQQMGEHGYGAKWSASSDQGETWSEPQWLSSDQNGPEYGFVSHAITPLSQLALFWLDGRNASGHHEGAMQLRSAVLDADGNIVARDLVDERVCDCCSTDATSTSHGPVVVYRDRTQDEIRDIAVSGSGLPSAVEVASDGWKMPGCPVNGPAIASRGGRLAVAWFTAASDTPSVKLAFASATGKPRDDPPQEPVFGDPIRVDLGHPVGRVDLVWGDHEHVIVSWIEGGDETNLLVRRIGVDGKLGSPAAVATLSAGPQTGFPKIATADEMLVVLWRAIEREHDPGLHLAEIPLTAFRR